MTVTNSSSRILVWTGLGFDDHNSRATKIPTFILPGETKPIEFRTTSSIFSVIQFAVFESVSFTSDDYQLFSATVLENGAKHQHMVHSYINFWFDTPILGSSAANVRETYDGKLGDESENYNRGQDSAGVVYQIAGPNFNFSVVLLDNFAGATVEMKDK